MRDFIVINYHVVSDQKIAHVAHLFPYKSPEMFDRDLEYLQHSFRIVSYDQITEHLSGKKRLLPKSVALTFDDGLMECYEVVRPLLLKRGIPCMFFVSIDYIDNRGMAKEHKASLLIQQILSTDEKTVTQINQELQKFFGYQILGKIDLIAQIKSTGIHDGSLIERLGSLLELDFNGYLNEHTPYLTSTQIQTMDSEGFKIGSHGKDHIKFSDLTSTQIEEAMADSCFAIKNLTRKQSIPFAFPHNADDVSRLLLRKILDDHSHIGLLFDANGISSEHNFLISRLNGDRPHKGEESRSNLSINIKNAYIEEIATRFQRIR